MAEAFPGLDLREALPRLHRYACALTGDSQRADDLVQDTLARAWEKRRLWRAGSNLRAWLFTIMRNVHFNQFAMRRRANLYELQDIAGTAEIPVLATQFDRVALVEVMHHVACLPEEQREVLVLAVLEGMSYEEVGRALDIPVGTVMSRISRAREKLRRASNVEDLHD